MAEITGKVAKKGAGAPTFAGAASGDTAKCGPGWALIVRNANAASRTVTIAVPGNTGYGEPNPDVTVTVAALTGEEWIPLIDAYRDPADRLAHISYTATTDVTRALVRIP